MEVVIRGCGVVSVGVIWFISAYGLGFSGGCRVWCVHDFVRVSFGLSVLLLTFDGFTDQQMEARDVRRHEAIFGERMRARESVSKDGARDACRADPVLIAGRDDGSTSRPGDLLGPLG